MKLGYILSASLIARCAVVIALPNPVPSLDAVLEDHFFNFTGAFDVSTLAAIKGTDLEAATLYNMGETTEK
jgi:hypothetical protein